MRLDDIPLGSVIAVYGTAGAGKLQVALDLIARAQRANPDSVAIAIDTVYRMSWDGSKLHWAGVDPERLVLFSASDYRHILRTLAELGRGLKEGAPVKALLFYELTAIRYDDPGLRPIAAGSRLGIEIARLARRYGITAVLVTSVRHDFDAAAVMPYRAYKPCDDGLAATVDYKIAVHHGRIDNIEKVEHKENAHERAE